MGSAYEYTCDKCGHQVHTSGPWEFYRDSAGDRRPYGHPCPRSDEARRAGIHGLSGVVYCTDCGVASDVILVEFKRPTSESLEVWLGQCEPRKEYTRPEAVKCPACGSVCLMLEPDPRRKVRCPICRNGHLVGRQAWIS